MTLLLNYSRIVYALICLVLFGTVVFGNDPPADKYVLVDGQVKKLENKVTDLEKRLTKLEGNKFFLQTGPAVLGSEPLTLPLKPPAAKGPCICEGGCKCTVGGLYNCGDPACPTTKTAKKILSYGEVLAEVKNGKTLILYVGYLNADINLADGVVDSLLGTEPGVYKCYLRSRQVCKGDHCVIESVPVMERLSVQPQTAAARRSAWAKIIRP